MESTVVCPVPQTGVQLQIGFVKLEYYYLATV